MYDLLMMLYDLLIPKIQAILGVTESHALPPEVAVRSPVDCTLTALQCSHLTLGYSLPPVSVEAFPSRGSLDVDGLFQQEFLRSPGRSITDVSLQLMGWQLPAAKRGFR